MKRLIKSVVFSEREAKILKEKSTELLLKSHLPIKESEVIHFMIDNMLHLIDADKFGMYVKESENETES